MRKVWPPNYDRFSSRTWSAVVAFTLTVIFSLWVIFGPDPPLILGYLTLPGTIAGFIFAGFDFDSMGNSRWVAVVWPLVNFVSYFAVVRCFLGILKAVEDIRNA